MSGSTLSDTARNKGTGKGPDGLEVGSHVAYLFSDAAEKQRRLFRFVEEVLSDARTTLLYIAGKQGVKGIRLSMKDYGIDFGSIERMKKIKIVDSEEWYLTNTRQSSFKPIEIIRSELSQFAMTAKNSGFSYVTIVSETDMLVRKGFFDAYSMFERDLGRFVSAFATIFVCAYDQRELMAKGLKGAEEEISAVHFSRII